MFATGNTTSLPGMARKPQPGRYEGASVSPSAAATLTHASLFSSRYVAVVANMRALHGPGRQAHLVCAWLRATRHATRSCQLPCGCLRTRDSGYPRYARDVASNARQEQGWGYVVPSPPLECSEEPRGPPYHHGYAARHGSTCACQFIARTNSGGQLARAGN